MKDKIISFVKQNILLIMGGLAFFFIVLPQGRAMVARVKTWVSVAKYKPENNLVSIDYHLLSVRLNDAFRGRWFREDETAIIAIINALPDSQAFNSLVYQYASDNSHDLRGDLVKHLNEKQYQKLKYK